MRSLYLSAMVLHRNGMKGRPLDYIAEETGIPKSTVQSALKHLERKRRIVHAKEYPADHRRKYNIVRDRGCYSILMANCYAKPPDVKILSYEQTVTGSNVTIGRFLRRYIKPRRA